MRYLLVVLVFAMGAHARAGDRPALESRRIQYLIAAIETLPNAQFIRNGIAYDAKSAADHLRLKLRNAGARVVTAEDFIRWCASVSSVSGLPYQIRFADGVTITSEAYLREKLLEFGRTSNSNQGPRQRAIRSDSPKLVLFSLSATASDPTRFTCVFTDYCSTPLGVRRRAPARVTPAT